MPKPPEGALPAPSLILRLCAAEVLTMAGVFAFPALLPQFVGLWQLSNAEAGWIAGGYFLGYAVAAPLLLTLTDRVDARLVYVGGAIVAGLTSLGFAVLADGFGSALILRFMAGVGLGATYMPGLKVLVDRYAGPRQSRAVVLYTSSFSLGTALSYFLIGAFAEALGWRVAFAVAGLAAVIAVGLVTPLKAVPPRPAEGGLALFAFVPVLRNRPAMGYVLAYGVHCGELFTLRSWMVAFLAASLVLSGSGATPPLLAPTVIAGVSGFVAMVASIAGNELALRFGRSRVIALVMLASALMAFGLGFTAPLPYLVVVTVVLVYTAAVLLDSGALTAGAIALADPARRGATMAVYSLIGFGCAGLGPLGFGVVLDLAGGMADTFAWGVAFAVVGIIGLLGPLALRLGHAAGASG